MQKPNLNLIIFDDQQQQNTVQIKKYTSMTKNNKPSNGNGRHQQKSLRKGTQNGKGQVISSQISQLYSKIRSLEREEQRIRIQLQKKNDPRITNFGQNTGTNSNSMKQIQQILAIVERKIQLVIQESNKLLTKMNDSIIKKFSQLQKSSENTKTKSQSQNNKKDNRLDQVQVAFRSKIQQYERNYKNQYDKFVKQSKRKEQTMMKKLSEIQLRFANRLNSFESKQKQYVDWIHHLEAKLKQRKSRKMITITQQKPQLTPLMAKNALGYTQNAFTQKNNQNLPSANFQSSKVNCSVDQNNSKVTRKHKIFGEKSKSPAPRNNSGVSPTKDSQVQYGQSNFQDLPSQSSFTQRNSMRGQNMNFYNQIKKQSNVNQQFQPRQSEGWDKFADLNDCSEQYTQSQSDDFFTPVDAQQPNVNYERVLGNIALDSRGGTQYGGNFKNQKPQQYNFRGQQSEEKVFSPFDLN